MKNTYTILPKIYANKIYYVDWAPDLHSFFVTVTQNILFIDYNVKI